MHNAWVCKTLPVVMTMTAIIFSNLSVMSSNWSVISSYALSVRLLSSSLDLLDDWQWQLQQSKLFSATWRYSWSLEEYHHHQIEQAWLEQYNQRTEQSKRRDDEIHSKIKYASTAAETNKKRSVKATVTGFILIKGVKSSESTKVRKSDVWGCLQRACRSCLSAVRFRTPFWRFETSKLRFFGMPPDSLLN